MSRDTTAPERVKKYANANRDLGLVQIHPWVPMDKREEFLALAERCRAEHRDVAKAMDGGDVPVGGAAKAVRGINRRAGGGAGGEKAQASWSPEDIKTAAGKDDDDDDD